MLGFFRDIVGVLVPVFVISTMWNIGLTQRPSDIIGYLKNWRFVLRLVIANFVLVPLVMVVILRFTLFDPALQAGLLIFSLCAGAPFLIKLTLMARHHLALGAAVMMLLMVLTVVYVPIVLPMLLPGTTAGPGDIARPLIFLMLLPIAAGMVVARSSPGFTKAVQPWIARVANLSLYAVVATTLVGYFPNMIDIFGAGAILAGLVLVLAAFGFGYLAGGGKDHLEDVGGLGTAQRNTAAGLTIATQNFDDPNVLVMLMIANTLGILMLLVIAKFLSRGTLGAAAMPWPPREPRDPKEL